MTYGSETWTLTKPLERKLRSAQRGMERLMLGVTIMDKKNCKWIREQTKVDDIIKTVKTLKWQWAGHICRRDDERWTKRVTDWEITNIKRPKGRPYTRWCDEIKKFVGQVHRNWKSEALDRGKWKCLGEAYVLQWNDTG